MRASLATILAVSLCLPVAAQTREEVQEQEIERFGYGELRPGANGNDPLAANYANFDETKVGDLEIPPLPTGENDWRERRAEIARLVESEWVGEVPGAADALRIVWSRQTKPGRREHWLGQVIAPDGRMGPVIDGVLSLPDDRAGAVPVVIEYTYIWPPDFRLSRPAMPYLREAALKRGWAHFAYRATLLQADDTGQLGKGVIGLTRFPREEHDWGALRAWSWGASRLREKLSADPRIDGRRISLAGHSRFGKAVLVAAAFDHAFADALVSSSGAGGAKLMRRDFGERLENMADAYASVWYAPRIRYYAGRSTVANWPVDAHMLIALRAPRPILIATGLAEKGDGWTDPQGQWIATELARPAWRAYGAPSFADQPRPSAGSGPVAFPLAFWQHGEGHVMWPSFDAFFRHAERFAEMPRQD